MYVPMVHCKGSSLGKNQNFLKWWHPVKKCFAPSLQTKNRGSTKSPLSSHQISTKFANFWSFFQKWMQHCTTKHVHYSSSCVSTSNWNSVAWFNPSLPCVVVMDNGNLYLWVKYNRRNFRSLLLPLCSYMGKFPVQVLMTKAAAKRQGQLSAGLLKHQYLDISSNFHLPSVNSNEQISPTQPPLKMQHFTSSTARGGGGSFKNRKPIGEIGCLESRMTKKKHWVTVLDWSINWRTDLLTYWQTD